MSKTTGIIFDLQGFSVNDGPGCRTLIFLKGCTLRCIWCANPEGQELYPIPMIDKSKCLLSGACVGVCLNSAICIKNEIINIDRKKCSLCINRKCEEECDTGALRIAGYEISVNELMQNIQRDRQYWGKEGGITLTGGEPFCQHEFAAVILKLCYEKYIHTAVETCGNIPWSNIKKSLPYIDWIFFDIKHIDPEKHKEATGCGNKRILDNLKRISLEFKQRLILRMAVIPLYNDSDEHIEQISEFIKNLNRSDLTVNILPLHHYAKEKYKMLNRKYFTEDLEIPDKERLNRIKNIFYSFKIACYIGSDTPF